ncbi:MAG: hypothetical protein V4638_12320 [Bacteroidota bacterium]
MKIGLLLSLFIALFTAAGASAQSNEIHSTSIEVELHVLQERNLDSLTFEEIELLVNHEIVELRKMGVTEFPVYPSPINTYFIKNYFEKLIEIKKNTLNKIK